MTTTLWIVQGLLAVAFLAAGSMKLMKSPEDLVSKGMGWAADFSASQVKAIGGLEALGAIGLILPVALNILPILTGVAAVGLVLTMLGAAVTHARRKEFPMIAPNVVLGAMAGFVAYSHLA